MSVKKHLPLLDRKTFMHKDEMAMLYGKGGFSGLNCRGGIRQFGVPHKVVEAIETLNWSDGMWQIGDGNYEELKKEICQFWSGLIKLDQACIKVGHGSMQVLERINKMFLNEEASVVGVAPQFIEYVTEVLMTGAKYRAASLKFDDYLSFNVDSVLREITSADTLVYIDNPNNPTGQLIGLAEIEDILKLAERKGVSVLIDEAYGDYADIEASAIQLINRYRNLIVTRTFTKGYQFAGIRVGYGVFAEELGSIYDKIDLPFPIPAVGALLARDALRDIEFMRSLRQRVRKTKRSLITKLVEKDFIVSRTLDTCPIFVLGHKSETCDLREYLLKKGILTLSGCDYLNLGQNYVRVTIPEMAEEFLERL